MPFKASAIEINLFGFSERRHKLFLSLRPKNILKKLNGVLLERWERLESNGYSDPKEKTTISFLRQALG